MIKKRFNSGFTFVEVAIALGVSSVVILGTVKLLKPALDPKTARSVEIGEGINSISRTISNRLTCAETLSSLSVGANVTSIKKNNVKLFVTGQDLSSHGKINTMTLVQSPSWTPVANGYGPASFKIIITKDGKQITRFFPISVQLDQNKKVVSCSQKSEIAAAETTDIYKDVCLEAVGGTMSGTKCRWTKPVDYVYVYIPAPPPVSSGETCIGPICDLYLTQLGRYPDQGGKLYWEEELARTGSLAGVSDNINKSREAQGLPFDQAFLDGYKADVNNRGLTLEQAQLLCGVNKTC